MPNTSSPHSPQSAASRKQALLARAAQERTSFAQAFTQCGGAKYRNALSSLLAQVGLLKGFGMKWEHPYRLAKIVLPFLLSTPYLRMAFLKFVGKRTWPLIKWGGISFVAWKGLMAFLKVWPSDKNK